jgi:hypothetical protein
MIGFKFGRLQVIGYLEQDKYHNAVWVCLCECKTIINVSGNSLRGNRTKSCGCIKKELLETRNTIHGQARRNNKSGAYVSWLGMMRRCNNSKSSRYKDYGGRGIKICPRWHSFENFYQDMGDRPEGLSLDRINNDGDYEPNNCKWSTPREQRINSRRRI